MSLRNPLLALTIATIVGVMAGQLSAVRGDDAKPTDVSKPADAPAPKAEPSAAEIAQWIKDLDSDTYAARQAAAQMLYDTGKAAIGPLTQAATGKSLESTMQAVNVLRRLSQSTTNKDTAEAARKALESLAQGQSSAAAPAKEALATPPEARDSLRTSCPASSRASAAIFRSSPAAAFRSTAAPCKSAAPAECTRSACRLMATAINRLT